MIGDWMLYQCAIALLLGLAAIAGERFLRVRYLPLRGVWTAAVIASVTLPVLMTLIKHPTHPVHSPIQAGTINSAPVPRSRPALVLPTDDSKPELSRISHAALPQALAQHSEPILRKLEQPLKWAWLTLTLATVIFYGVAMLALARTARRWPLQEVDGILVRVAPTTGPAVLGYLNPEIVLPRWLLSAPPSERALVLAHERAHIQARDQLLRLGALLLAAAVPWSMPLWWQLRRLRLSIEVDCDARVLSAGASVEEYGSALVAVCRRRAGIPLGSMSMAAHASSLERRLQIMVESKAKQPRKVAAAALALITSCVAAAVTFPAPSRLSDAVVEQPPISDVPFFMAKAEAVARRAYPSLFEGNLQGTEVIAVDLDIDGRLLDIERDKFSSGPLSTNHVPFELAVDEHDVWHISGSRGLKFIGWFGSHHDEGLYVSYRVLMWPHDPSRAASRVLAAVAARYSEYFRAYPASEVSRPARTMSVFMSDDGTISRASAPETVSKAFDLGLDDREAYKGLLSLGLSPAQFGHRGMTSNWQAQSDRQNYPNAIPLTIYYAWPRRADDPPDQLLQLPAAIKRLQPQLPNQLPVDLPNPALLEGYFPAVWQHGPDSPKQVLWMLLDREGKVWGTGESAQFSTVRSEILALYPDITLGSGIGRMVSTAVGTPVEVALWWLGEDSPVTNRSALDFSKRDDVLVFAQILRNEKYYDTAATPLNFGVPAETTMGNALYQLKAISSGEKSIAVQLNTKSGAEPGESWTSPMVRIGYGNRVSMQLPDRYGYRWRVLFRAEHLRPVRDSSEN